MKTIQLTNSTKWILFLAGTFLLAFIVFVISFGEIPLISRDVPSPSDALPAQSKPLPIQETQTANVNLDDGFTPPLDPQLEWKKYTQNSVWLGDRAVYWRSRTTNQTGELNLSGQEWLATKNVRSQDERSAQHFPTVSQIENYYWKDSVDIGEFHLSPMDADAPRGLGGIHGYIRTDGIRIQALLFNDRGRPRFDETGGEIFPYRVEYYIFLSNPTLLDIK